MGRLPAVSPGAGGGATQPTTRRSFLRGALALSALCAAGGASACSRDTSESVELFQFKSEAIGYFDELCRKFSDTHPSHPVQQNFQAENIAALRVRLVKEDIPETITLNGDYNFGALARTGIFADCRNLPVFHKVIPTVGEILGTLGRGGEGQVNGLPLSTNGSGVIYNVAIFDKHGVEPPRTWDEFIDVCERFVSAGVNPFYWAFKDNWTGAPMFSSLSGDALCDGVARWYDRRRDGRETFTDTYRPILQKMKRIASYGNSNKYELGYNDGNQGFAQGRAAMYVHGTYAIPAIRSYNPDIELGTFAMPADDEKDTRVVSGVDVALVMPPDSPHHDTVMEFFNLLMTPGAMKAYCDAQVAYPTLTGTRTADPALAGLQPYFTAGRIATYSDHNFPPAMNLNAYMQQFLIDGDVDRFARTLDRQWDRVMARTRKTQGES